MWKMFTQAVILNNRLWYLSINTPSSSPDQNSISHPPSIGGDFGVPDFSKYKGGGFDLHF